MAFAPFYYDPKLDFERLLDEQAANNNFGQAPSAPAVAGAAPGLEQPGGGAASLITYADFCVRWTLERSLTGGRPPLALACRCCAH